METWEYFKQLCDEYEPSFCRTAYVDDRKWLEETIKWEKYDKDYILPLLEEVSLFKDKLPLFELHPIQEIQETNISTLPALPKFKLKSLPILEEIEMEVIKDGKESTNTYQKSEVPTKKVIQNRTNRPTFEPSSNKSSSEEPSYIRRYANRRPSKFMETTDNLRNQRRINRVTNTGTDSSTLRKRELPKRSER